MTVKARRKTTRFGLAGGHHLSRRRIVHRHAGRKPQDRYSCTRSISASGIKMKFKKLNNTSKATSYSTYQLYKHAQTGRFRKRAVKQLFHDFNQPNGYRLMNLLELEKHVIEVSMHSAVCTEYNTILCTDIII